MNLLPLLKFHRITPALIVAFIEENGLKRCDRSRMSKMIHGHQNLTMPFRAAIRAALLFYGANESQISACPELQLDVPNPPQSLPDVPPMRGPALNSDKRRAGSPGLSARLPKGDR